LGNIRFFGKKTDFFPNNPIFWEKNRIFWEKFDFLGKNPIFRLCNNFFFKCLPPRVAVSSAHVAVSLSLLCGKPAVKKLYSEGDNMALCGTP
jgi:hypothetical protein